MKNVFVLMFLLTFLFSSFAFAQQQKNTNDVTSTYLIEMKHTKEECLQTLETIKNKEEDLLSEIHFGCAEGNHTGYMMVEAISERAALKDLPEEAKTDLEVHKLSKFTPEQIESYHKN
jgi:broad specificity phosphatase PhoE